MPDPIDIQYWLRKKGKTQRAVARHCNVTDAFVSQVINRKRRSAQVETVIARWTGRQRKDLFPGVAA